MKTHTFRRFLCWVMVLSMLMSFAVPAMAADEVATTIYHTQTSGDSNYFTFSPTGWDGGDSEHTWSANPGSDPSEIWYTVKFVGHKIDVYAGGNWPMGSVDYYIDDVKVGTYDLYLPSNQNSRLVSTFDNLSESEHVFKAVATGKNGAGGQAKIDCAKVIVYHEPYQVNDVTLAEPSVTISQGATKQIRYTVSPSYAELANVQYTSGDSKIASVSDTGLITGVGAGSTQITVTGSGITRTVSVTVQEAIPGIAGSIVDTDTQWTQDRYEEVKTLGTLSDSLTAWRNDVATSALALVSVDSALENVTVTASNFVSGSSTIPASAVTATFIRSTTAYNGGYVWGNNPPAVTETNRSESSDILWTTQPTDVPYNSVQPVWVEIAVPKDAAAGTYTGTLTVTADGLEEGLTFTYTLTVQDVVLPDATEFAKTFDVELWQYPYSSAEYYDVEPFSPEHLEILRPIMEVYKSIGGHAITTTIQEDAWSGQTYSKNDIHYPSMIRWEKVDGVMTYDYTHFDAWVSLCKEMGIGDKIVLYSIAPWHNTITYWEDGVLKSESNNFGNITSDTMWEHFLHNLIAHLEEKGWFDDAYIGIDERGFSKAAFDLIDSVVNSEGVPLKTAGAMDGFVNKWDLAMRVTDLNVGDTAAHDHPAQFAQLLSERQAKGYRTTLYSCTGHQPGNFSLCSPVESYWIILNCGRMGTAGFLRWAYDAWVEDPLNDTTHSKFEAGDCFLVFPDEKDAENPGAYRSVRLARIAEGVRDINKLMYIAQHAPTLADEIDGIYAKITDRLSSYGDYTCPTGSEMAGLRADVATFKTDLVELTNQYVTLMAGAATEVESVTIDQGGRISVDLGSTAQLTAKVLPENVLDNRVVWTSSNPAVVTVAEGLLTGKGQGTATVTAASAMDPTKTASIQVTVDLPSVDESKQVSYYSFNNVSGGTVTDEWSGYDATMKSGATTAEGKSGNALSVNEAGMGAIVEINSNLPADWTVAYWVKTTADFTGEISVMEDEDQLYSTSLKMAAGRDPGFRVGNNSGDVLTYQYDFQKDTWYHIAWVQDKDVGLSMYVNGAFVKSNNWTVTHSINAPIDVIGGTGFTGLIDEVKIYNAVLTAEEINMIMQVDGVNLKESYVEIDKGDTYQIEATVVSSNSDKSLTYESGDTKVATVDENGLVTGVDAGSTTVTVTNSATGYSATLTVKVIKRVNIHNVLTRYTVPEGYLSTIERAPGTDRQYLGQPDMIQTATGRLIMAYPVGHGKGPLVMRISDDGGLTWTEKTDIPSSWAGSQETPTLYTLNLGGKERLLLITACPGWGTDSGGNSTGWNVSYSDDNGDTWTQYEHFWTNFSNGNVNKVIVAMASLIQLKDENGNYIEKWMGVYHNYDMVNYKTYLTFNEDGSMNWTEPVPYLSQYRSIESSHQICEVGLFRSPDGNRIVGLARSQSHMHLSTMFWSDDEGQTWSEPVELPGSLAGERHKAMYDPDSGKLLITFREIQYDRNNNGRIESGDWYCGDWGLWVGTYEQLMNLDDGEYCATIDEDFAQNTYSGDTGYAGFVRLDDGTFVMCSYGHWDEDFSKNWGFGNVTTDLCYIRQARFTLADLEHSFMGKGDHRNGVKWTWADDLSSATATVGCLIPDCDHAQNYDAVISSVEDQANAIVTCTAKVTVDGTEYSDTEERTLSGEAVVHVNLEAGKNQVITDESGDHSNDVNTSRLDETVAKVDVKMIPVPVADSLSDKVTELVSGRKYLIYNTRAQKPVTNQQATNQGATGLSLNGTKDRIEDNAVWTLIKNHNGSYSLRDANGNYMTVGSNSAGLTANATELTITSNGEAWTIKENGAYLNHFGGSNSTCAAGWQNNEAAADGGSQWEFYEVIENPDKPVTEITFTGVGAGDTYVQIGDTFYHVSVFAGEHEHVFEKKVVKDENIATSATCDKAATYYFCCTVCGVKGEESTFEDGAALGHAYGEPVIVWNDDYTATATVTCANDETHVVELEVEVTSETTEGDCETAPVTTYTATVVYKEETYTSTKKVEGELGQCADEDKDHACDVCGENVGKHEDTNKDHKCDYGCSETIGVCEDKDNDGKCDYGCDKEFEVKPTEPDATEPKPTEPDATEPDPTEPEAPKAEGVTRLAGENRLVTSELIANQLKEKMGVEKFQNIIVASGGTFADALPGSYLAAVKNAPIVLTLAKQKYIDQTANYIKANLAEGGTVYILGGESAVPKLMEEALAGINVKRVAGADRFGTNLAILKEAGVKAGDEIMVCTAKEFADSLSAAATGKPILLVYKKITDEQKAYLQTLSGNTFCVVGGTTAVPENLEEAMKAYGEVSRLAGKDRLDTSILVAKKYFPDATSSVVAFGWDFPDGLCGGSLAYATKSPLILAHSKEKLAQFTADYTVKAGLKAGYVLGGEGLVDDAATRAIFGMGSEPITLIK